MHKADVKYKRLSFQNGEEKMNYISKRKIEKETEIYGLRFFFVSITTDEG
jgi:hypothetical protein